MSTHDAIVQFLLIVIPATLLILINSFPARKPD